MRLIRTMLYAGCSLVAGIAAANATDFYVTPVQIGPVSGTPLGIVTIEAQLDETQPATVVPTEQSRLKVADATSTTGKWLRPRGSAATARTTTTVSTATAPTAAARGTTTTTTTTSTTTAAKAPLITASATVQAASNTTYPTVGALLNAKLVKGGDRIFLLDGYHGPINFNDQAFAAAVVLAPIPGGTAHVDSILVRGTTKNLVIRDLKVWPRGAYTNNGALIRTYPSVADIAFVNLDIRGDADSGNYLTWTKADWLARLRVGFMTAGKRITITGNRLTGIGHGILGLGDDQLIENNTIDGFALDGMRALGDNSVVRGNKIQNCFQVNGNHADAFQSFTIGANNRPGTGVQYNVTIENNKFFEWTAGVRSPLTCALQGIGLFDGIYDGFMIRNNVIVVSAGHGIALYGTRNTVITQNTVVHPNGKAFKHPWIRVVGDKGGTPPNNVRVANNFASNITVTADPVKKIVVKNNVRAGAAATEFVNFAGNNLELKSGSTAIDKGDPTLMAPFDLLGAKRFKGKGPDVGAYEDF